MTVVDRDKYERSQLSVRSIYELKPNTKSYWDVVPPAGTERGEFNPVLAAPIISTIDFFSGPPDDILETAFPEKIVLAFYASTCGNYDDTLCRNVNADWDPAAFLARPEDNLAAQAMTEYNNNRPGYFGLSSFNKMQNISVGVIAYRPHLETDEDLLETGGGRDVVTGEQAQQNVVDITFTTGANRDEASVEIARYEMLFIKGKWKILRRIELNPLAESPIEVPAQSQ